MTSREEQHTVDTGLCDHFGQTESDDKNQKIRITILFSGVWDFEM
jgi:hypothetical protein